MAEKLSASVGWRLADMLKVDTGAKRLSQSGTATFVRMDDDGTAWIRIPGNDFDTPVEGGIYVDANGGDTVNYTISGGQVSISGNATTPAVGGTYVAEKVAPVERKALQAKAAADMATADAARAHDAADAAQASADDAATAASSAQSSANDAATAAQQAISDAANAATAAATADGKAVQAGIAAAAAQSSANSANTYANAALDQLGVVQDVIGVLTWATEHGSFTLTSDTTIVDGKVYFTYDSQTGDYTPVVDPQASALSTYYELSVDEAMEAYIMAHLAVTSRGLWVLPSGIGSGTTPASGESQADSDARQGSGYKMLLASNGMYLYDANGVVATNVGENITFSSDRDWYIGSNAAYIFFDASEGTINIGGAGVEFNGTKTLSDLLSDVSGAAQAASAASSAVTTETSRRKATYGTCSTTASTTAKIVTCNGFEPYTGARMTINMTTASTATAPTLTIQDSDSTVLLAAKEIWFNNAVASSTNPVLWAANSTLDFVYDGTRWVLDEMPPTYVVVNDTSASTQIKATTLAGALVVNGTTVMVRFANANTYASGSVQFNLGSTGAMPIYTDNAVTSSTHTFLWDANTVMTLAQQGGSWHLVDGRAKTLSEEAKKVATNYISVDTNGIRIANSNPSTASTYQHQTATETEFVVDNAVRSIINSTGAKYFDGNGVANGNVTASFGTYGAQIGRRSESHLSVTNSGMSLSRSSSGSKFDVGLGPRTADQGESSTEPITEVPVVHELEWTPQQDSIRVLKDNLDRHFSPPSGETTYAYTLDGKEVTLTDARLVGYNYCIDYTATDFSDVALTVGSRENGSIGRASTAFGYMLIASGEYSHAEGNRGKAEGNYAHAEGLRTKALDGGAHAEGGTTTASGYASHAEGVSTTASGYASHAEGRDTKANGYYAHAQNQGTWASVGNQTAIGRYNLTGSGALIIGNGTDANNRSNALTVDWLGNVWAAGKATLTGAIEAASATIAGVVGAAKLAITKDSQDSGTTAVGINDGTSDVLIVDWDGNIGSGGSILNLTDGADEQRTYLEAVTEGHTRVGTHRSVNGTDVYNNINLIIDSSGNRSVVFSSVVPWQKALGTHYLPGDTISGSCRAGGYVTNSTKDIRWTIPLSKPIVGSIACTSMSMSVRMAGTYIYGSSSGNASVPVANLTCTVTPSGIDCQYRAASAITGATNNSECGVEVSYSFDVS